MNLRELVRNEVLALPSPYVTTMDGVRLDGNENPFPPPGLGELNRYPAQPPIELLCRMAAYYGLRSEQILPTRGADDAIDTLMRGLCRPGQDGIVITSPTFGMYRVFAQLNGVRVIDIPLADDYRLPRELFTRAIPGVKLVFLCSPNNPTGNAIAPADIEVICRTWSDQALVVVDEAYAEFMRTPSAVSVLDSCPNLVVLRTLSKGLAVAGARVGAALAAPELLAELRKVLPPYPLPTPSVDAAVSVLSEGALEIARERIERLNAERERLRNALEKLPSIRRVWPSEANFLLVECTDVERTQRRLLDAGVYVRAFAETMLQDCVRIAVGSAAENRVLLSALEADRAA